MLFFNNFLLICIAEKYFTDFICLPTTYERWSWRKLTTWNLHHVHEVFKSFVNNIQGIHFCFVFVCEAFDGERTRHESDVFLDVNGSVFGRRGTIIKISVDFNCVLFVFYLKICFILLNFVDNPHLYARHQFMQIILGIVALKKLIALWRTLLKYICYLNDSVFLSLGPWIRKQICLCR